MVEPSLVLNLTCLYFDPLRQTGRAVVEWPLPAAGPSTNWTHTVLVRYLAVPDWLHAPASAAAARGRSDPASDEEIHMDTQQPPSNLVELTLRPDNVYEITVSTAKNT